MGRKLQKFKPYQPESSLALIPEQVKRAPRVPFYKDITHTIPTKWSLYRPLIRALKGNGVLRSRVLPLAVQLMSVHPVIKASELRRREGSAAAGSPDTGPQPPTPSTPDAEHPFLLDYVRARWRKARGLRSLDTTRDFLRGEYATLDALASPSPSLDQLQSDAVLFASKVAERIAADKQAAEARAKARQRPPLLTGAFMRPTIFNVPMPRMKPQPESVSMMIRSRTLRRERRIAKDRRADDDIDHMRKEIKFWRLLGIDDSRTIGDWSTNADSGSWESEYLNYKALLGEQFEREARRAELKFTTEQIESVMVARRRRHAYRVNSARAKRGLPPAFEKDGSAIPGATGSAYGVDREKREEREREKREERERERRERQDARQRRLEENGDNSREKE